MGVKPNILYKGKNINGRNEFAIQDLRIGDGNAIRKETDVKNRQTKTEVTGVLLNIASGYETHLSGCQLPNRTNGSII